MTNQVSSSVEDLFKHFREEVRSLVKTQSGTVSISPDAVVIAAALLSVAAVIRHYPTGRADLLQTAMDLSEGEQEGQSPALREPRDSFTRR
jgi:hypothetical protein